MAEQANPIWHISEAEAKNLARAVQLFQKEFDIPVSDRAVAIGALGSALWFVYGTRLSALYMDAQARKQEAAKKSQAPNVPLRQQPPSPPPPKPADVHQPAEGFVNGAASFSASPSSLVDPVELAKAIANPLPPGKAN